MQSTATYTKAEAGEARWWLGSLAVIRATAEETGGRLAVIDVTEAPGAEAPLHLHHNEDEAFYVLEGTVTIEIGGETVEAAPGDLAWAPRGVPHRYTAGPEGCRMLFICTPGGFEDLVRELSAPAAERTLPPPSQPDYERVARVAAAHGCEVLA